MATVVRLNKLKSGHEESITASRILVVNMLTSISCKYFSFNGLEPPQNTQNLSSHHFHIEDCPAAEENSTTRMS